MTLQFCCIILVFISHLDNSFDRVLSYNIFFIF
jgi:hypothetical protein